MKLSVVIPCYNEHSTLLKLVQTVKDRPIRDLEIILVDDASSDGTRALIDREFRPLVDKVMLHETNRGKGGGLRSEFGVAAGDVAIVQDADLEYEPREYPKLLEPILHHGADVVFGSRPTDGDAHRLVYFCHMVGNSFLTLLTTATEPFEFLFRIQHRQFAGHSL